MSLESSHSPWSNFLLTLICLLSATSLSGIFVGLVIAMNIVTIISSIVFVFTIILFIIFKRG